MQAVASCIALPEAVKSVDEDIVVKMLLGEGISLYRDQHTAWRGTHLILAGGS